MPDGAAAGVLGAGEQAGWESCGCLPSSEQEEETGRVNRAI